MYLAEVRFGRTSRSREESTDTACSYLSVLREHGQIGGEYFFEWARSGMVAFTHLARPNSFAGRHHSRDGTGWLRDVRRVFGREPDWRLIADDVPRKFRGWKSSTSFYLYADAISDSCSPVRCGDFGTPIPPYLLPLPFKQRWGLTFWADRFRHCEWVWLDSGALEIPAYRELTDLKSELSTWGRDDCRLLEQATGIPVYYFWVQFEGREEGEDYRNCPACSRPWRDDHVPENGLPFHRFPFRCEPCRLVSHRDIWFDDQRKDPNAELERQPEDSSEPSQKVGRTAITRDRSPSGQD